MANNGLTKGPIALAAAHANKAAIRHAGRLQVYANNGDPGYVESNLGRDAVVHEALNRRSQTEVRAS